MSLHQLFDEMDEIHLFEIYTLAHGPNGEDYWSASSNETKYKGYISVYVEHNRMNPEASFSNFIFKIEEKMRFLTDGNEYGYLTEGLSVHSQEILNQKIEQVYNGEKTWLQGLCELFTLRDLEIYGW
jgi:hypothetical protein